MNQPKTDMMLLSPYQGPSISTPHRVALAPMTRNRAGEARTPNAMMAEYYAQRASAGLLITEAVDVSKGAIGYPGTPGLYDDAQRQGWSTLAASVREAQPEPAPMFLQLFHAGRVSHGSLREDGSPGVAPSAVQANVELYTPVGMQQAAVPHALDIEEIGGVLAEYVAAAKSAIEAGFDGVEINAGNGYLVDQFLRDGTNVRTDDYGGPASKRVRFLVELVEAIGEAVGPKKVAVRISPINGTNDVSDSDPRHLFTTVVDALASRSLAYLHVIEAAERATITPILRERFEGTLIANDGYDRDRAERAIREGYADLVSFGRAFLANPDLPHRLRVGAPLGEPDPATFYGGTEEGYTTYPSLQP